MCQELNSLLVPVHELLEQSGRVPDEMMDVLLGGCGNNTRRLERCSIGFASGEQVVRVNSFSASVIQDPLTPPPAAGGWALLGNGSEHGAAARVVVSPPGPSPEAFPSTTFVGEQGCLQRPKQKRAPSSSIFYCVSTNAVSKVSQSTLLADMFWLLDPCSVKQGFSLSLEKRRTGKNKVCAII